MEREGGRFFWEGELFWGLCCFFKHVHYRVTQRDASDSCC